MCIIVSKPEDVVLKEEVVKACWDNNSDGAGFMYAEDGKLNVLKGYMDFDSFIKAYEPHKHKKLVMHFRIKTHGKTNEENTHPFNVDNSLAFAHNGTISGFGSSTHSDTWHFNEEIVKDIRSRMPSFLQSKAIVKLLEEKIGWSKLAFMDNKGKVTIINEEKGVTSSEGVWFSNESFKERSYSHPLYIKHKQLHNIVPYKPDSYIIKQGDFTVLAENVSVSLANSRVFQIMPKGTVFEVKAFDMDNSVDVYNLEDKETYNMPNSIFLDKITTKGWVQKPWGHFNVGKLVFVVGHNFKYCRVIDPILKRLYDVPTKLLHVDRKLYEH